MDFLSGFVMSERATVTSTQDALGWIQPIRKTTGYPWRTAAIDGTSDCTNHLMRREAPFTQYKKGALNQ